MECPNCKKRNLKYLPWLGQLWECQDCGYRGPLFLEDIERKMCFLLNKIPKKKVTTYKVLAKKLRLHPRQLGRLLNKNKTNAPCYKVIYSNGKIGGYRRGVNQKIRKLKRDGIEIKNKRVNLKKYLFRF